MTGARRAISGVALLLSASALASFPARGQQTSGSIGSLLFPGMPAAPPPASPGPAPAIAPTGTRASTEDPVVATSPLAHPVAVDTVPVPPPSVTSASPGSAAQDRPSRARPLFSATRRPPPVPVVLAVPPPPIVVAPPRPVPDLRLIGVVDRPERAVAFLRRAGTDKTLAVHVGDRVQDWVVEAVEAKRIVLRDGQREQAYALFARSPVSSRPRTSSVGSAGQSQFQQPGR